MDYEGEFAVGGLSLFMGKSFDFWLRLNVR